MKAFFSDAPKSLIKKIKVIGKILSWISLWNPFVRRTWFHLRSFIPSLSDFKGHRDNNPLMSLCC